MRYPGAEWTASLESLDHGADRTAALQEEVAELFDQLRRPLFRYLLSLGLPAQEVEEIVQEVFLALFQHLRRGKPRHNLAGWAFRVGHNMALKARARRAQQGIAAGESAAEQHLDPAPTPEQQMADHQQQQRLMAVVRALPEQDRACLALRAEGLRYREIAGVLGMSLGAVALSLGRSLERLSRSQER